MYQLIGSCSLSLAFFLFSFPCCLSFSKLFARTPQDAVKWFLFFPLSFFLFLPLDLFSRRPAAGIPLVRAVCSGWAQCHVKHLGKPHILCVATIWRYSRETDASSERERQAGVCYTDTTHTYTRDDVTVQSRSHLSILSLRFTWRLSLSLSLGHNKTWSVFPFSLILIPPPPFTSWTRPFFRLAIFRRALH